LSCSRQIELCFGLSVFALARCLSSTVMPLHDLI